MTVHTIRAEPYPYALPVLGESGNIARWSAQPPMAPVDDEGLEDAFLGCERSTVPDAPLPKKLAEELEVVGGLMAGDGETMVRVSFCSVPFLDSFGAGPVAG